MHATAIQPKIHYKLAKISRFPMIKNSSLKEIILLNVDSKAIPKVLIFLNIPIGIMDWEIGNNWLQKFKFICPSTSH